jgi:rhodanese-related sulfurtransferase
MKTARELVDAAATQVHTLAVAELRALLGSPGLLLVDIREADEIAEQGRIPGALHVPRGLLEFRADASSPWAEPALLAASRCVLYCGVGWRSALAAKALQDMGHPAVSHLGGGFEAWRQAGGPVESSGKQQ